MPDAPASYAFFIEGGTLGVENALKTAFDWKVRRNRAKGIAGAEGPADPPLPRGVPRPLAATRSRSRTPTRARPTSSRKFAWPRVDEPEAALPGDARGRARRRRPPSSSALERDRRRRSPTTPTTSPRSSSSRSRRRAATTTSAPSSCGRSQAKAREHDVFFILDEVQTGIGITGRMWAHEHFGLQPGRAGVRQEDPGLRLHGRPAGRRGAGQRLQGLLAHQLDLGRRPHRHGPLRRASSRSSRRTRLVENARVVGRAPARRAASALRARAGRHDRRTRAAAG